MNLLSMASRKAACGPATLYRLLALLACLPGLGGSVQAAEGGDDPLLHAITLLSQNRLEKAEAAFKALMEDAEPGSQRWLQSAFGYANCLHQLMPASADRINRARELYEQIHATAPDSPIGIRCLLLIGNIHDWSDYVGDEEDNEKARPYYLQVVEKAPQVTVGLEAAMRYAVTWIELGYNPPPEVAPDDWETRRDYGRKGVEFLEAELMKREPGPAYYAAWEMLTVVYRQLFIDFQMALETALRATGDYGMLHGEPPVEPKRNLDRINPGYMYWRIGLLARKLGYREIAYEYYTQIIEEVHTYKGAHARRILREMGFPEESIPPINPMEAFQEEGPEKKEGS